MPDFLEMKREGAVVIVTLNRPSSRNAIAGDSDIAEFESIVDKLNADIGIKAMVLTGAGSAFCAGGDLQFLEAIGARARESTWRVRDTYRQGIQRIPLAFQRLDVPVIAAVNGPAMGAGCDLACMCDMRIASSKATFAESFVKLGIIPGDGGAWLLPRVVGLSRASQMAFTGDVVGAEEALRIGLVSEVVPPEQLMEAALALAERIAANPAPALRLAKQLLREAMHVRLDTILELSAAYQAMAHQTDEHRHAVAAMIERTRTKAL